MNIIKKVLAVTVDSFGGDQSLRAWAKLNGFNFSMFNSGNAESGSAMIAACEEGALDVCKWLLKKVNGNAKDLCYEVDLGLRYACKNGHLDVLKWILGEIDINRDEDGELMHTACEAGQLKICEWLFEKVNHNRLIFQDVNLEGKSSMGLACENGHLSVCEWLLDKGGQILINGKEGGSELSPLNCASAAGQLDICRWLISHGAEIAKDNHGGSEETPIKSACEFGQLSVCKWLLEEGGEKLIEDENLPIHSACTGGNLELCKLIFSICGAKGILTKDHWWGYTAMHYAVCSGNLEICKWLFELISGEDKLKIILTANNDGLTPMHIACQKGHREICKWLFDVVPEDHKHSTILTANNDGLTPMHIACQKGHREICKWLLLNGALNTMDGNINLSAIRNFITDKASNKASKAILNELRLDIRALKAFSLINRFFNNVVRQPKEETASVSMVLTQEGSDQEVSQTDIDITDMEPNLESIPLAVLSQISDFVGDHYSESARDVLEALSIVRP